MLELQPSSQETTPEAARVALRTAEAVVLCRNLLECLYEASQNEHRAMLQKYATHGPPVFFGWYETHKYIRLNSHT
jgi:hypothetical protein